MQNTIIRRDPFDFVVPMERLINRVFPEVPLAEAPVMDSVLPVDVSETPEAVVVRASLPGYRKEDVTIEVNEGVLTINAKHEEVVEENKERYHRRERRYGTVSRTLELPTAVTEENANAELVDGVLTLTLPKLRKEAPKRITVK